MPLSKVKKEPHGWSRYFDNIFFMWNIENICQENSEFIKDINSFHPTIKFLADLPEEIVNFLDAEVTSKDCTLSIGLFTKPDDTS